MNSLKSSVIVETPDGLPPIGGTIAIPAAAVDRNLSLNYSLAKVIAILTIMAGHWFTGTILWIPVTFGLFVFAFSSAYFTSRIYGVAVDRNRFWRKKLERLGLRFWVILTFLAIVVGLKGGTVLHWHTVVHLFGLSGVLNWLAIPNRSGLGAGLWFFTLLLLFYVAYPFLAKLSESKIRSRIFAMVATLGAVFLESKVNVGHELWLTSLGFILGVVYGTHDTKMGATGAALCFVLSCGSLFAVNVLSSHREFNIILITAASISLSLWLSKATLVYGTAVMVFARLEKYLLEIFLIHTYLFVHFSGNTVLDFGMSVLLIIAAAMGLNKIVEWLSPRILERRPKDQ
jgi:hypothetical protein